MKNRLTDLADHLFAQLERLGDEATDQEAIKLESARSGAMTATAREIISIGRLALDAAKVRDDLLANDSMPTLLGLDKQ